MFADGGYAGSKLEKALAKTGLWALEIVRRSDTANGCELLSRRWVVERTPAWLSRIRRLAKNSEAAIESAKTWLMIAGVKLMIWRLARPMVSLLDNESSSKLLEPVLEWMRSC